MSHLPRRSFLSFAACVATVLARPRDGLSAEQPFEQWLQDLRREAEGQGISRRTLDAALRGVSPIPRVLELDRAQPESRLSFADYLSRTVTVDRVREGRELLQENRSTLDRVSERYAVQPRFIVALWGMESSFGRNTGRFSVINALATLAYDGRRSAFFRGELLAALRILDQGHIAPDRMLGSWAGAMGQSQFMPSSFERFAVDFDGDGRRDIWTSRSDVFASAANYLARNGWNDSQTWGRPVSLPAGFRIDGNSGLDIRRPLAEWQALGVRREGGGELPPVAIEGSLVLPDGASGRAFLVYHNYRVILRWNRSTYFATAVGLLSDGIGGAT